MRSRTVNAKKKTACEVASEFCSNQGVHRVGFNGFAFNICLACHAIFRRRGAKFREPRPTDKPWTRSAPSASS